VFIHHRDLSMAELAGRSFTSAQLSVGDLFPIQDERTWLVLPHPSGRNLLMNDAEIRMRVIEALRVHLTIAKLVGPDEE
jgi:hypothetical protein